MYAFNRATDINEFVYDVTSTIVRNVKRREFTSTDRAFVVLYIQNVNVYKYVFICLALNVGRYSPTIT